MMFGIPYFIGLKIRWRLATLFILNLPLACPFIAPRCRGMLFRFIWAFRSGAEVTELE